MFTLAERVVTIAEAGEGTFRNGTIRNIIKEYLGHTLLIKPSTYRTYSY